MNENKDELLNNTNNNDNNNLNYSFDFSGQVQSTPAPEPAATEAPAPTMEPTPAFSEPVQPEVTSVPVETPVEPEPAPTMSAPEEPQVTVMPEVQTPVEAGRARTSANNVSSRRTTSNCYA